MKGSFHKYRRRILIIGDRIILDNAVMYFFSFFFFILTVHARGVKFFITFLYSNYY